MQVTPPLRWSPMNRSLIAELQLAVEAIDLPDLLGVFRDVDLAVLGAVGDLVHHRGERTLADLLDHLALRIEHLDVRLLELIGVGAAEQRRRDRDPEIAVAVDRGGRGRVQALDEDADLVAVGHHHLGRIGLHGDPLLPATGLAGALHVRAGDAARAEQHRRRPQETGSSFHVAPLICGRGVPPPPLVLVSTSGDCGRTR